MPIYEYRCVSCGAIFEYLVRSSSDEDPPACPSCNGDDVHRALSVFAAHQGQGTSTTRTPLCARCGDPNGPCPMNSMMQ